jgi:hypothetical protein
MTLLEWSATEDGVTTEWLMGHGMERISRGLLESNILRIVMRSKRRTAGASVSGDLAEIYTQYLRNSVYVLTLRLYSYILSLIKWSGLWLYRSVDVWSVIKLIVFAKKRESSSVTVVWSVHCSWARLEV